MVNFKAYVIIWFKCASILHLQVSFCNIYATVGLICSSSIQYCERGLDNDFEI